MDSINAYLASTGLEWYVFEHTRAVVGLKFEGRHSLALDMEMVRGDVLRLERQPSNPADPNAVAVYYPLKQAWGAEGKRYHLGYLKASLAAEVAPLLAPGVVGLAFVEVPPTKRSPVIFVRLAFAET